MYDNTLEITGNPGSIKNLFDKLQNFDDDNFFEGLVGYPDLDNVPITMVDDKLKEFWGCKYDVSFNDVNFDKIDDNTIHMNFESDWSAPWEVFKKLCSIYGVEASIMWECVDNDVIGKMIVNKDGIVTLDEYYSDFMQGLYDYEPSRFWDDIEYRIGYYFDNEPNPTFKKFKEDYQYLTKEDIKTFRKYFFNFKEEYVY